MLKQSAVGPSRGFRRVDAGVIFADETAAAIAVGFEFVPREFGLCVIVRFVEVGLLEGEGEAAGVRYHDGIVFRVGFEDGDFVRD